jgi:long-chain fatty acid transport protein
MHRRSIPAFTLAAAVALAAPSAFAGGLEANGYNWDQLFDAAPFAARANVTGVWIDQDIQNGAGETIGNSTDRVYYNATFKGSIGDAASCLVSAQNPWGSGTEREGVYAATTGQALSETVDSTDIGLTCAYGVNIGPGVISLIGGVSAQSLEYDSTIPLGLPPVTGDIELDGEAVGWRAGVAYEIPEMALRVSAIYNAPIDYELEGELSPLAAPVTADVTTPQSFEIKAQSGVAPGWLVLGSVKWVDWSVLDELEIEGAPIPLVTELNYEDGWTVTAGVGHAVTEELSVLASLTWDKGTSREDSAGVLENGTQTDRWGIAAGASYRPSENFELSAGASYSILAGGENSLGETWDSGSVTAFTGSVKASF